ncbi:unnamed protein product [Closterium sp. Naga37s-1]|nr:unnamed protein product [Closterium sp. Naga37s-1]
MSCAEASATGRRDAAAEGSSASRRAAASMPAVTAADAPRRSDSVPVISARELTRRFVFTDLLGEGKFGRVWRCLDRHGPTSEPLACKQILTAHLTAEQRLALHREIAVLQRLQGHPNALHSNSNSAHAVYAPWDSPRNAPHKSARASIFPHSRSDPSGSNADAAAQAAAAAASAAAAAARGVTSACSASPPAGACTDAGASRVALPARAIPRPQIAIPRAYSATEISPRACHSAAGKVTGESAAAASPRGGGNDEEESEEAIYPSLFGGAAEPEVRLADFGMACEVPPGSAIMGLAGSEPYEAPEMVEMKRYDHQADVWSLGVLLHTLLSATWPEFPDGRRELVQEDLTVRPWPSISEDAKDLIRQMLVVDPNERLDIHCVLQHPWLVKWMRRQRGRPQRGNRDAPEPLELQGQGHVKEQLQQHLPKQQQQQQQQKLTDCPTAEPPPAKLIPLSPLLPTLHGSVLECTDKETGQGLACKVMLKNALRTEADKNGLRRRLEIMKQAGTHLNVVSLVGVFEDTCAIYVVMERCLGGDLLEYISKMGAIPEPQAAIMFRQLASAVAFCHDYGILHRNLKPENVFLTYGTADDLNYASPALSSCSSFSSSSSFSIFSPSLSAFSTPQSSPARHASASSSPSPSFNPPSPAPFSRSTAASPAPSPVGSSPSLPLPSPSPSAAPSASRFQNPVFESNSEPPDSSASPGSASASASFSASAAAATATEPAEAVAADDVPDAALPSSTPAFFAFNFQGPFVRLNDFTLATRRRRGSYVSGAVGSLPYKSPEMILKGRSNEKADIWSLGVILYSMLSARWPFYSPKKAALERKILNGHVDFSGDPWPSISDDAKDLVRRMLAVNPNERPSATELLKHPWVLKFLLAESQGGSSGADAGAAGTGVGGSGGVAVAQQVKNGKLSGREVTEEGLGVPQDVPSTCSRFSFSDSLMVRVRSKVTDLSLLLPRRSCTVFPPSPIPSTPLPTLLDRLKAPPLKSLQLLGPSHPSEKLSA